MSGSVEVRASPREREALRRLEALRGRTDLAPGQLEAQVKEVEREFQKELGWKSSTKPAKERIAELVQSFSRSGFDASRATGKVDLAGNFAPARAFLRQARTSLAEGGQVDLEALRQRLPNTVAVARHIVQNAPEVQHAVDSEIRFGSSVPDDLRPALRQLVGLGADPVRPPKEEGIKAPEEWRDMKPRRKPIVAQAPREFRGTFATGSRILFSSGHAEELSDAELQAGYRDFADQGIEEGVRRSLEAHGDTRLVEVFARVLELYGDGAGKTRLGEQVRRFLSSTALSETLADPKELPKVMRLAAAVGLDPKQLPIREGGVDRPLDGSRLLAQAPPDAEMQERVARGLRAALKARGADGKMAALTQLISDPEAPAEFWEVLPEALKARQEGMSAVALPDGKPLSPELIDAVKTAYGSSTLAAILLGVLTHPSAKDVRKVLADIAPDKPWLARLTKAAGFLPELKPEALKYALGDVLRDPKKSDTEWIELRTNLATGRISTRRSLDAEWEAERAMMPGPHDDMSGFARAVVEHAATLPGGSAERGMELAFVLDKVEDGSLPRKLLELTLSDSAKGLLSTTASDAVRAAARAPDRQGAGAAIASAVRRSLSPGTMVWSAMLDGQFQDREKVGPTLSEADQKLGPVKPVGADVASEIQRRFQEATLGGTAEDGDDWKASLVRSVLNDARVQEVTDPVARARLADEARWINDFPKLDLAHGEAFPIDQPFPVEISGANAQERSQKKAAIDALVHVTPPANALDRSALAGILGSLSAPMLERLQKAGYSITVARHDVTAAESDMRGQWRNAPGNQGRFIVDQTEAFHRADKNDKRITIRSYFKDGVLQVDAQHLLAGIGFAYDQVFARSGKDPLNVEKEFTTAFEKEHDLLPAFFHAQEEYFGHTFALYMLDRERMARAFPLTAKAFDEHFRDERPDLALLHTQQRRMQATALSPSAQQVHDEVQALEKANALRAGEGKRTLPYVVALVGEQPRIADGLAAAVGDAVVGGRAPGVGRWGLSDPLVHLDSGTFNDPAAMQRALDERASDNGAVLYLNDLANVTAQSPGFALLKRHFERFGGQHPLVLAGTQEDVERLRSALPTVTRKEIAVKSYTPEQMAEQAARHAKEEGYELSQEAIAKLKERGKPGGPAGAEALWLQVKLAQGERTQRQMRWVEKAPENVNRVVVGDVEKALGKKVENPMEQLEGMVDLDEPKAKVRSILESALTQEQKLKAGMKLPNVTNTNIIFSGNPGTGKTEMAKLVAAALGKEAKFFSAADFKGGDGPKKMADLFRANKGSLIFIDEAHQLPKDVFEAMIAFTGDHAFVDTPVILAGYPKPLIAMLQQDKGGQSRFETVNFPDYSRGALGRILDKKLKDGELVVPDDVRASILDAVDRRQRAMLNPDNGRSIEKVLAATIRAQEVRLVGVDDVKQLKALTLADVPKGPSVTPRQALEELQKADGLDDLKATLWGMEGVIAANRKRNAEPLEGVPTNFVFTADTEARRDEVMGYLAQFLYSEGLLTEPSFERHSGNQFQGGFMGNSTDLRVHELYDQLQGKLMVIERPTGMTGYGTYEKEATGALKDITESNRQFTVYFGTREELGTYFDGHPELLEHANAPVHVEGVRGAGVKSGALEDTLAQLGVTLDNASRQALGKLTQGEDSLDVKKVAAAIRAAHVARAATSGESPLSAQDVEAGLKAYRRQIAAFDALRAGAAKPAPIDPNLPKLAVAARAQVAKPDAKNRARIEVFDQEELKLQAAIALADKEFDDFFDKHPEQLAKQQNDPNSDYMKAVARHMGRGVKSTQAHQVMMRVKEKFKRLITVNKTVNKTVIDRVYRFRCAHCHGNNPNCPYKRLPIEEQAMHNEDKGWEEIARTITEQITEQKEVEDERIVQKQIR